MEKALCDWPILLQYDAKAKYLLISRKFSSMKFFSQERSLNQPKATRVCIRLTNHSNRSISVRLFFLFCSCVFISSGSHENCSIHNYQDWFIYFGRASSGYNFSCWHKKLSGKISVKAYPICDSPFKRSARHSFAPFPYDRTTATFIKRSLKNRLRILFNHFAIIVSRPVTKKRKLLLELKKWGCALV